MGKWGSKSVKGELEGKVCAISRNGKEICHIQKSGRTSEGILEDKFWDTVEAIRYTGHLYGRIGEGGANGSNVGTHKGGWEEHL